MSSRIPNAVAVIDDDRAVLESLRFMLEMAGYPVATYASATSFLEDRDAHPRCLILDHHMPAMTGLDLATKLYAEHDMVPILLITAAPSPAIVTRAAEIGITRVLEKPPTETDLITFVESCAVEGNA
jgi:two-component system, LuxR family, response regulator FixJ